MPLLCEDEEFRIVQADCIPHMHEMPEASIDFAVFSPPFPSMFSYTSLPEDLGNSTNLANEAKLHFQFFFRQLARVIKPGRVIIVHCMQIPALARNGETNTFDFRGLLIRIGLRAGLVYDTDWAVTKNPQSQAIRTHSHKLLFVTLERDRAVSCPAFTDYLIKFRARGENKDPICSKEITRNEWIDWAEGVWDWHTIRETDTLNTKAAKSDNDTRHICPLQLPVIRRLVKLYTNPGETVFSPFAGIGSEGYEALHASRKFYGCEIKDEYFNEAIKNCERAITERSEGEQGTLFAQCDLLSGVPATG